MSEPPGGASATPAYDRVAHAYDRTRGWPKEVEHLIGAGLYYLISRATGEDEPKILEIGVGTGRVAVPLAAQGGCVYGVDVSSEMLGQLAAKSAAVGRAGFSQRLTASLADAQELPFPAGAFDAGLVVHILHLLSDWRGGLAELQRVVRPSGVIALGVDEAGEDEADWASRRWGEIVEQEGGKPGPPDTRREATIMLAAEELEQQGYTVQAHILARWIAVRTPALIVGRFRDRLFSSSWDLPNDVLHRAVARLESELLDHFESLDVQIEREQRFRVLLARREG